MAKLQNENAPLRALVSGQLISVSEDFYDHLIMKHIPDGEFRMGYLTGALNGNYPLGVNDSWYELRINKMIAKKKLTHMEFLRMKLGFIRIPRD